MPVHIRHFHDAGSGTFSYLLDDGAGACAVIDPVMGFDLRSGRRDASPMHPIAEVIKAERLQLQWILETHAHADHLSGGPWLQQRFGGRIGIGEHITQVQQVFGKLYGMHDLPPDGSQFDRLFADGDRLAIGEIGMSVMHVPGHTPADVAYLLASSDGEPDAVFVGDTLFMPPGGTARCDFPGGDARSLFRSVRRLLELPPQSRLFVCHDYPTDGRPPQHVATVAEQRAGNIHVRDGVAEDEFVVHRTARDATLALPLLMLAAVQVNIRAGHLPPPDEQGACYLRIPVDRL